MEQITYSKSANQLEVIKMNPTSTLAQILSSKAFADFYAPAAAYCDFIEQYTPNTQADYLQKARQLMLNLYASALQLQSVDLTSDVEFDHSLDEKEFEKVWHRIAISLKDARYYWHVFDPTNAQNTEALCGDLMDDLGDIYKDLKTSLLIFNLGQEGCKENAIWQFKFDFEQHWGDHCINALGAIHFFLQQES